MFSAVLNRIRNCDPRDHQLMVLASMLAYGLFWLKFDLNRLWLAAIFGVALGSQYAATRIWRLPRFEWKSAAISGLSLTILMRSHSLPVSLALPFVAVFSKFVIRWRGKHVFNPTDFALVLGILVTRQVWIAPNQWGNGAILAFFIFCMGAFVVNRAARSDVSFAFLGSYAFFVLLYFAANGASWTEPVHRLLTGSLLVFAFFMISDPKTTPDSRPARLLFGASVALAGACLQLFFKVPAGLLIALAFLSMSVPALDWLFPGSRYRWGARCESLSRVTC